VGSEWLIFNSLGLWYNAGSIYISRDDAAAEFNSGDFISPGTIQGNGIIEIKTSQSTFVKSAQSKQLTFGSPAALSDQLLYLHNARAAVLMVSGKPGVVITDGGKVIAGEASTNLTPLPSPGLPAKTVYIGPGASLSIDGQLTGSITSMISDGGSVHVEQFRTAMQYLLFNNALVDINVASSQPFSIGVYGKSNVKISGSGSILQINIGSSCESSTTALISNLLELPWDKDVEASHESNAVTTVSIGDKKYTGLLDISGQFILTNVLIENEKLLSLGNQKASPTSLAIANMIIRNNGALYIAEDGHVYVESLSMTNSAIASNTDLNINRLNLKESNELYGEMNVKSLNNEGKHLKLVNAMLAIDRDLFHHGMLEVVGNSMIVAKSFLMSNGQITGSGSLSIQVERFIMQTLIETITQYSNGFQFIDSKVASVPEVKMEGSFEVLASDLAKFEGVPVHANNIRIKSEGKVFVLPAALYRKIHRSWGNGHETQQWLDFKLTEFTASSGIHIVSKEGTYLYAPSIKSRTPVILSSDESVVVEGVYKEYSRDYFNQLSKTRWYGKKTLTAADYRLHKQPILPLFESDVYILAEGGLDMMGVLVHGSQSTGIVIGSEARKALLKIHNMIEVHEHHSMLKKSYTFAVAPSDHRVGFTSR
jgi:hypothetical protein